MSKPDKLSTLPSADEQQKGFRQVRAAHRIETIEDYVELIADLHDNLGCARQVEIAKRMGVAQPTVAKMLRRLENESYLRPYHTKGACLTEKGWQLARQCRQRHQLVEAFLMAIGVSPTIAKRDAEGIEHHVSRETLSAFQRFLDNIGST